MQIQIKTMKKWILGLVLSLCLLKPTWAGPKHYIKTHKTVLVVDALVVASIGADLASSVHCQHLHPTPCTEENWGAHPSNLQTWGVGSAFAVGFIAAEHLQWHYAPNNAGRYFMSGLIVLPITIDEYFNVRSNVNTAINLQAARQKLLRER